MVACRLRIWKGSAVSDTQDDRIAEVIVLEIGFPRGGGAVTGRVLFTFHPEDEERDGAEIEVMTGAPWNRDEDRVEDVRLRLAENAHRLLVAAAALPRERLRQLVTDSLSEDLLPDLHQHRRRH